MIERLTGIYHAEGSLSGELRYWIGARLGRTHCALCDITHGSFREKSQWKTCRADLPVPFETVHLDERTPEIRTATEGHTPSVIAHTTRGLVELLGPDDLISLDGDPEAMVDALGEAAASHRLVWQGEQ